MKLFRGPSSAPLGVCAAALAVAALACVTPVGAAAQSQRAHLVVPDLDIDTFTLANGLVVIVSEDHSTPIVAVEMWYRVGSAHEPPGRSGFAHLFEHLLFEETEHMADGEFGRLIQRAGGIYNGSTTTDRTAFNELVPGNRLNLVLWSHAERMARLRITDDDFETQREVVKEERRLRVDNQPYARSQLSVDTMAMRDYPPYRHTVIGSMDDLDAASSDDARDFYRRFYAPNHAVLAVVGDVTTQQVRSLVEEYFGDIPRGPDLPELPPAPAAPRTDGERRRIEEAPTAQLPLIWMAYNLPPATHPDHPALALLAQIFSTGESSRLRRRLVTDERAALDVIAQVDRRMGPGLLLFGAVPNQGVEIARLEALIDAEVQQLVVEGVSERELEAARNQVLTGAVTQRMTVASKAALLQAYTLYYGAPHGVNRDLRRFEEVTPDDVRRVAATYLVVDNRTVVVAQPPHRAASGR